MGLFSSINSALNHTAHSVERIVDGREHTDRFLNESHHGGTCFNVKDRDTGAHNGDNMSTGGTYYHQD